MMVPAFVSARDGKGAPAELDSRFRLSGQTSAAPSVVLGGFVVRGRAALVFRRPANGGRRWYERCGTPRSVPVVCFTLG
jgi:hypothetical protein